MDAERLGALALDLFFPNRCPLCGKVIRWDIPYCEECFEELPRTGEELCRGCGNDKAGCSCGKNEFDFVRCYAAFYYAGTAKSAVLYLKDTKNSVFPDIAAEKLYSDMTDDSFVFGADMIVPVPMRKGKYRRRGYNHAEVIADSLSRIMGIPVKRDALEEKYSFFAQHTLSAEMRRENAENKYRCGNPDGIEGKTIILCDDVITTGSTMNECAGLLKEMGAAEVIAAAAATTK